MYNYDWTVNSNNLDLHILSVFSHVYLLLSLYFTCVLLNKRMLRNWCLLTGEGGLRLQK